MHAYSLTILLNVLIDHTQSPLVLSKLEGDAVFSYAPSGGFLQGQTLLDMIEIHLCFVPQSAGVDGDQHILHL